jgi:hypothetical protein
VWTGGALTPAQAKRLKQEALQEMGIGEGYLRRAGAPGTDGEQENLALAHQHLGKAQLNFDTASSVLTNDGDLDYQAQRCARMLYTAQKRMIVSYR